MSPGSASPTAAPQLIRLSVDNPGLKLNGGSAHLGKCGQRSLGYIMNELIGELGANCLVSK